MASETNLQKLLTSLKPELHAGEFVFCTVTDLSKLPQADVIMSFQEKEGITVILNKSTADKHQLDYPFIAAWITLTVHSSLQAVGLTAAFANALAKHNISCNVVAAFYHDHIFVDAKDAHKAVDVLNALSTQYQ